VEWGLIFPDANGDYQSPINLNSREAKYDPSLLEVRLSPNYVVCRDCEVTNDGHSIQIALKSKSGTPKRGLRLPRDSLSRELLPAASAKPVRPRPEQCCRLRVGKERSFAMRAASSSAKLGGQSGCLGACPEFPLVLVSSNSLPLTVVRVQERSRLSLKTV